MKSRTIKRIVKFYPDNYCDSEKKQFIHRFIQRIFTCSTKPRPTSHGGLQRSWSTGGTTFLTISLAFLFSFASAQTTYTPPTITWQKSLGGSGLDDGNCVRPTSDGGFIVAATSSSNDGDMTVNQGKNDFWLIKLNDSGNLVWQRSYGGSDADNAVSVVQTLDGGFALAGTSASNNGDIKGNHGLSDYCLIKTDDQGIIQWQKSYGGSLDDQANFMEPTSDNGFVLVGKSFSNDGDVSGNHGMGDACIMKLDQNGNLQWEKTVGGSQLDIAKNIKQTRDGGYFVTGYSLSSDGDIAINKGQEDLMYFKLDANGNLQWLRTMGGSGGDFAGDGVETIDGGYVMCGLTHSDDFDIVDNIHDHDMWVIKTDSLGVMQWTRCLGGTDLDNGIDVKEQSDGTIITAGYTTSNDSDVTNNHGGRDFWLVALDPSGNLLWQKTLGGSGDDVLRSVQIISTGQYLVAGKTNSDNGDVTENQGSDDCWIVKVSIACNNVFYKDSDGDGYGSLSAVVNACSAPSGYVADHSDCNDGNASVHPGASDVCNGIDDNCDGKIDENAITAIATLSGAATICDGSSVALIANIGTGIMYQWIKGNSNISGETNSTYVARKAGTYKVSESNSFGCSSASADSRVSVYPDVTATISYTTLDLCGQSSITLTADTGEGLTYQWKKGGSNISGATNQTYSATAVATYRVVVTNAYGCSKASSTVTITKSCKENSAGSQSFTPLYTYPNPNSGHFTLDLQTEEDASTEATLEVFNEIGQQVYRQVATVNQGVIHEEVQLPVSMTPGIYFVKVALNDRVYTGQISYQK